MNVTCVIQVHCHAWLNRTVCLVSVGRPGVQDTTREQLGAWALRVVTLTFTNSWLTEVTTLKEVDKCIVVAAYIVQLTVGTPV